MRVRDRSDQITLTLGSANVALLKDAAAREGLPVSALVRELVSDLAGKGASDGK